MCLCLCVYMYVCTYIYICRICIFARPAAELGSAPTLGPRRSGRPARAETSRLSYLRKPN